MEHHILERTEQNTKLAVIVNVVMLTIRQCHWLLVSLIEIQLYILRISIYLFW